MNSTAPVLILSGSQHLRRTIELALRLARHQSQHMARIDPAIAAVRTGSLAASAIVVDAFLPDPATLARLRELVAEPPVPLVVLAGFDVSEKLSEAKSPKVRVLVPPFTMNSLTWALRDLSFAGALETST